MVTFDSLGLILSISSSILPGFQHTMAFSQDWGETMKKKKSPVYTLILHIDNYNYNQTFHLTASPITLQKVQQKNLTSVLRSQPHHQQYIAAHHWEPAALAALPGNRTAGALPHALQRKSTRCAQTHFHEQLKLTSI